jgi:hypothetical protein
MQPDKVADTNTGTLPSGKPEWLPPPSHSGYFILIKGLFFSRQWSDNTVLNHKEA